jgi:uncharacterized membrane protein
MLQQLLRQDPGESTFKVSHSARCVHVCVVVNKTSASFLHLLSWRCVGAFHRGSIDLDLTSTILVRTWLATTVIGMMMVIWVVTLVLVQLHTSTAAAETKWTTTTIFVSRT